MRTEPDAQAKARILVSLTWRTHSCVPRRDSSRRSRSTTENLEAEEPARPSQDSPQYKPESARTRRDPAPNDRTIPFAKTVPRCAQGEDWLLWLSRPSAIS